MTEYDDADSLSAQVATSDWMAMHVKKRTKALVLGVTFATILALVPATANAATSPATATPLLSVAVSAPAYSGEAVFRAVAFGDLSGVPELAGVLAEAEQSSEGLAMIDQVISDISASDPGFFLSFGSRMQSGDVHQVEQALADAAAALTPLLEESYATDPSSVTPACAAALSVFFFAALALVVGVAAVLVTAAVATQGVYATNYQTVNNGRAAAGTSLTREKLIAALTQVLAS